MTSANEMEPAGVFIRVSTGGQDEAQQVPAVEGHCAAHGYRIAKRYELNDKSASKGEQQAKLDEMLEDMRDGTIKVLVVWRSNRLERRGVVAVYKLLSDVKDAGGRIESTTEPLFGIGDMSSEMITTFGAIADEQFSIKLSEDTNRAISSIKASGFVYNGNAPWGFDIVGPKYGKTIVPTDVCRKYAPKIFQLCINGWSLRKMAAWLDSEGVPTVRGGKWNEGTVRWIIRQRAYAGRWVVNGKTICTCEAVVAPTIFDNANAALKAHGKRGPITGNRPMLVRLRCARCDDSPMYPIKHKTFYRCTGRGAQRKGCGNMVSLAATDVIVATRIFMTSTDPYETREWVDGSNWDDEISNIKQDLREAVDAERFGDIPQLQAQLEDLRGRETVPGHYEYTDTGMTIGDYFDSLDFDGKREYLETRDIRVEKVLNPEPGASVGLHVVIDGIDHGVFAYPPKM